MTEQTNLQVKPRGNITLFGCGVQLVIMELNILVLKPQQLNQEHLTQP